MDSIFRIIAYYGNLMENKQQSFLIESYLMVTEDCHFSVCSVVRQHLGRDIVVRVGQLVQLLLQGEGGVVRPEQEPVRESIRDNY